MRKETIQNKPIALERKNGFPNKKNVLKRVSHQVVQFTVVDTRLSASVFGRAFMLLPEPSELVVINATIS